MGRRPRVPDGICRDRVGPARRDLAGRSRMGPPAAGGGPGRRPLIAGFGGDSGRGRLPPLMSTETPSFWSPILSPEVAEHALRVVEEIAADVRESLDEPRPEAPAWVRRGPSLAGGDTGEAYFFTYLDQVRPGQGFDDVAMAL